MFLHFLSILYVGQLIQFLIELFYAMNVQYQFGEKETIYSETWNLESKHLVFVSE